MNKNEFLATLRERLNGLPEEDIIKSIDFYAEMLDDRMEDGMNEAEAVEDLGSVEEIISQILSEVSLPKLVKEKVKPKRALKAWEIVLLVLGAPLWIPLLAAVILTVLAIYLSVWSVIISLYAVDLSVAVSGLACIGVAVALLFDGQFVPCGVVLGAGLVCLGLSILLFFGFNLVTKGILWVSKKALLGIKGLFIGK
ncbi:MAG: DUF1700 domain-containing protein [Lachnospiraceae bacterium]|nr:DUF1700 domain-containing protein [Lachnospiraceae bacterium]